MKRPTINMNQIIGFVNFPILFSESASGRSYIRPHMTNPTYGKLVRIIAAAVHATFGSVPEISSHCQ
jgi:hypothetical protein